jgi:hypothetical protein
MVKNIIFIRVGFFRRFYHTSAYARIFSLQEFLVKFLFQFGLTHVVQCTCGVHTVLWLNAFDGSDRLYEKKPLVGVIL